MIQQIIPAGAQMWHRCIVAAHGRRIAYCSTLSIYLYRLTTNPEPIESEDERSPFDPSLLVSTSLEKIICIWNVDTETLTHTVSCSNVILWMEWSSHKENILALSDDRGVIKMWNIETKSEKKLGSYGQSNGGQVLRWNPRVSSRLASGDRAGNLILFDMKKNTNKTFRPSDDDNDGICQLQWDPLGETYVIVAYQSGKILLFDTQSGSVAQTYESQGQVIGLYWITNSPGTFFTADSKSGSIHMWNVSMPRPTQTVKMRKVPCTRILFIQSTSNLFCTFQDGCVGVYNLDKRRWDFLSQAAHSETIFDCQFNPKDPNTLATSSFDGSVKLWDLSQMKCIDTLQGNEGVVYSCSWSNSGDRIVAGTSRGKTLLWDTTRGVLQEKLSLNTLHIYKVAWNRNDDDLIATCSKDGLCIILNGSGTVIRRYKHPRAASGCDWAPNDKSLLVTGCQDGLCRIWDVSQGNDSPIVELKGHRARVFNCVWSPMLPGVFASGSDDTTLRIWSINETSNPLDVTKVLTGHTQNVRAITWSTEIPWLVISGSWDASIRLWDVRSGKCIRIVKSHHADVYGLSSHRARPFVFASTSRDTTVRMWSLEDEEFVAHPRLTALVQMSLTNLVQTVERAMVVNAPHGLCGPASDKLNQDLMRAPSPLVKAQLLADFFCRPEGLRDLFQLLNERPNSAQPWKGVIPLNQLVQQTRRRARELEAVKHSKNVAQSANRGEKLREASELYLRLGMMREYCDTLVDAGEWERAIAVAPAVSMDYWRSLSSSYANHLVTKQTELANVAEPFLMASNSVDRLIEYYQERNLLDEAVLVSKVDAEGGYSSFQKALYVDVGEATDHPEGQEMKDNKVRLMIGVKSDFLFRCGSPIAAASCHLSMDDRQGAMQKLMKGNEIELAYLLSRSLKIHPSDHIVESFAFRCETFHEWNLAAEVTRGMRKMSNMSTLVLRATRANSTDVATIRSKANMRAPSAYQEEAEGHRTRGNVEECIRCYLLSGENERAAQYGLEQLNSIFGKDSWDFTLAANVINLLAEAQLKLITESVRKPIVAYSYLVAAQLSIWKNYYPIVLYAVDKTRTLFAEMGNTQIATFIDLQYMTYMLHREPEKTSRYIEQHQPTDTKFIQTVELYSNHLKNQNSAPTTKETNLNHTYNEVVAFSSTLPLSREKTISSLISKLPIHGQEYVLEDKETTITLSEAIMWHKALWLMSFGVFQVVLFIIQLCSFTNPRFCLSTVLIHVPRHAGVAGSIPALSITFYFLFRTFFTGGTNTHVSQCGLGVPFTALGAVSELFTVNRTRISRFGVLPDRNRVHQKYQQELVIAMSRSPILNSSWLRKM
ncbi:hypothetical protein PROFUN_09983 [Planoprotostelium fungivorum]|uniref:Uncharacterized protein n=1 Tax=Planoprotostelium fungivorum TaxID=1890364 RepID=A0A2P6NFL6_9EUKA|nr:hypothetical protein PROFUN_09983 [Planoprotostelium fungivorum]